MAAPKRPTHRVVKSGLYFSPKNGELAVGDHLTLTDKQAEKLEKRGMVEPLKDVKTVDASEADAKALADAKSDLKDKSKKLIEVNKALTDKDKEIADVTKVLAAKTKELDEAKAALAASGE